MAEGKIRRLVINIPPGHCKSLLVCVLWPAWVWLSRPAWRAIFSSFGESLVFRDAVRWRDLITSTWYREAMRPTWALKGDQNMKSYMANTAGGYRVAVTVGGSIIGHRADCAVTDDPLDAKDRFSPLAKANCIDWWDRRISTRLNDPMNASKVIIQQRLAGDDLSGHVQGYEKLVLPTEFEPHRRCSTSIGWTDPRKEKGELLFPALLPGPAIEEAKKELGPMDYAAQHQQLPVPAEGGLFKDHWLRFYRLDGNYIWLYPHLRWSQERGIHVPEGMEGCRPRSLLAEENHRLNSEAVERRPGGLRTFITTDLAVSLKDTACRSVCSVWGDDRQGNLLYLHQERGRYEFPDFLKLCGTTWKAWNAQYIGIEKAGFQLAAVQTARRMGMPIKELDPSGRDKAERSVTAQVRMAGGMIWLPDPDPERHNVAYPPDWAYGFIQRLMAFTGAPGEDNDDIDTLSYAAEEQNDLYGKGKPTRPQVGVAGASAAGLFS